MNATAAARYVATHFALVQTADGYEARSLNDDRTVRSSYAAPTAAGACAMARRQWHMNLESEAEAFNQIFSAR